MNEITAWEYSATNCQWILDSMAEKPIDPAWGYYVQRLQQIKSLAKGKVNLTKCAVINKSIFELPAEKWEVATMFFCAESITSSADEFDRAMDCFLGSLKPNGSFFCAFMEGSEGYTVADKRFPAYCVYESDIRSLLNDKTANFSSNKVQIGSMPIRDGYSGIVIATGNVY